MAETGPEQSGGLSRKELSPEKRALILATSKRLGGSMIFGIERGASRSQLEDDAKEHIDTLLNTLGIFYK